MASATRSSTGTGNKRQAETIEQKLKEEVNDRRFQIVQYDPDMTVAALAARFIADGPARPHHISHLKVPAAVLRRHSGHAA